MVIPQKIAGGWVNRKKYFFLFTQPLPKSRGIIYRKAIGTAISSLQTTLSTIKTV
jgi:hypothetical protein